MTEILGSFLGIRVRFSFVFWLRSVVLPNEHRNSFVLFLAQVLRSYLRRQISMTRNLAAIVRCLAPTLPLPAKISAKLPMFLVKEFFQLFFFFLLKVKKVAVKYANGFIIEIFFRTWIFEGYFHATFDMTLKW